MTELVATLAADMIGLAESITFAPLRIIFHPPRRDAIMPAAIIAIKSHWIWLQDMIWGGKVKELVGWNSDVALLEEDHAVTPDYFRCLLLLPSHFILASAKIAISCLVVSNFLTICCLFEG